MGERLPIVWTQWAKPYDRVAVCNNMDAILRSCGVADPWVRRRLIAHSVIACGWAQLCYHFNAWKTKLGGWTGDYYVHNTEEEDKAGNIYVEKGTKWRAFTGWQQAVDDTLARAKRYPARWAALNDPNGDDGEYWRASKSAKYFTDTKNWPPEKFAALCRGVEKRLNGSGIVPSFGAVAGAVGLGVLTWAALGLGVAGAAFIVVGVILWNRRQA